MSRRLFVFPFLMVAAASLLACSSDDDSSGAAPTVRDLSLTPTAVEAGKPIILDGRVTVEDADGDIQGLSAELALPDGTAQGLQDTNIAAGSATSAPVQLKVQLILPVAGDYTLRVWARDRAGNVSGKLDLKLTAS